MISSDSSGTDRNYDLSFEIPKLPPTINLIGRSHWAVEASNARKWKSYVALAVGRKLPSSPLERAKITLIRHSSNEPDYDGLVSSMKATIDGLVGCGVLKNDKMSNIGVPNYLWRKARRGEGKISVIVEGVG